MARLRFLFVLLAAFIVATPDAGAVWEPDVEAARAYAQSRPGDVAFALRVGERVYRHRSATRVPAASLIKTMLLAAYLRRDGVRRRSLRAAERRMLAPMIRRSDDAGANRVHALVGSAGLARVARAAGMRDFRPAAVWGSSTTSARDQALLYWRLERILPRRHRRFAFGLLGSVVPGQRWGVPRAAPQGWRVYFKGGWGSGRGLVNHQAALLVKGRRRIALAITTTSSGSHAAGSVTLRGVARRLLAR